VIIGGIATLTTLFAKLAEVIEKAKGRRMQGAITLDVADHIVVLGYTPGRTERILDELLAKASGRSCSVPGTTPRAIRCPIVVSASSEAI
jgi:hypothetical protein